MKHHIFWLFAIVTGCAADTGDTDALDIDLDINETAAGGPSCVDDGNPCTTETLSCGPLGCKCVRATVPNGRACGASGDVCQGGACRTPCASDCDCAQECRDGVCSSGFCEYDYLRDDHTPCTGGECQGGVCEVSEIGCRCDMRTSDSECLLRACDPLICYGATPAPPGYPCTLPDGTAGSCDGGTTCIPGC